MRGKRLWLVIVSVSCSFAQRTEPEVYSPLGKAYFARPDPTGVIAKADKALADGGEKADLVLAAARARDQFLRFADSIPIYTRGMQAFPEDVRFPRFRGHRLISIRRFDAALVDLKTAAELAPASFDVAYHLGLAYYLRGDYNHAAREYNRCLALGDKPKPEFLRGMPEGWRACYALDADSRVALTDWAYRALRRAGKHAEAKQLLERINESMAVKENTSYWRSLLFYKGARSEEQTLANPHNDNAIATVGYGVAVFHRLEGRTDRACELLQRIVNEENWSAFGLIGAETDLARGLCAPVKK
jgi:tetratricopeptide (TPR) repeat protein